MDRCIFDIIRSKQDDTHFHLAEKRLNYDLLQFWQSSGFWSSCCFHCSPQTLPKLLASVRFKRIILFLVPTKGNADQATQETATSNESIIYISSGIAFILLLVLCFILSFWCCRRSYHKQIKRLFTVVVNTYDQT